MSGRTMRHVQANKAPGNFPSHLKALLQHALPKVTILTITYPKYETRGDLTECVARFKEWLTDKVIDLEVANSTPSPTVDLWGIPWEA
jgi:hypothetical protein